MANTVKRLNYYDHQFLRGPSGFLRMSKIIT